MKKTYKTLLAAATVVFGLSASAQVSLYGFSQLSGSYSAITGGTVFGTTTTDDDTFVNAASPATSGNSGVGIPIGFNFTFDNNVFDRFGINNNGWIGFGQSGLTPNAVNISNSITNYFAISAVSTAPAILQYRVGGFSRDLQAQSGGPRVETIGSSPNQVCVIQWSNYKKWNNTGDDFNFQIRLYETSNRIEIVYGTMTDNATVATAEVGLRGQSNADYNNRLVDASNPWNASIAGTINTAAVNVNNTGLSPASGQIYRWDPPPPCVGAPATNTIASTFTMICPGGQSALNLTNTYSNTGITYQWFVSDASAVGPFTVIPSATTTAYTPTNVTITSWYQAVVTCSAGPISTSITAYNLLISGTTTNSVPYYEGFEGIVQNNQLPNCSWAASNLPTINQTYITAAANNRIPHTGSKFASFRWGTAPAGDYFYTNGIQMEPGITYSASVWYITDGNLGWSELSLLYGTTQTTTGLTSIASLTGAVSGQFYQQLSNTFTVPASGLYYVAIKCRATSSPLYMSFDDLSITIPCSLNSPSVTLVTTPTLACTGQEVNIVALGADSYSWSTGEQTSAITFTPFSNYSYNVVASSSVSGCSTTLTEMLTVNNAPVVSIFANSSAVCAGSTATLHAFGATTYTWNSGSNAQSTTVTPSPPSASYTVLGSNASGCIGTGVQMITVNTLPNVTASSSAPNELCVGETATLTGHGALNYEWKNNSIIITTPEAYVSPTSSTSYTLIGTDANGCSATTEIAVTVSQCVGLRELTSGLNGIKVYPNPSSSDFTVELNNGLNKNVELLDLTGRVILNSNSSNGTINMNIKDLAAGVYYVKISSGNAVEVIKLIKN